MAKIELVRGVIATIGKGQDSFQMVVDKVTDVKLIGPHLDGIGICHVPVGEVVSVSPATTVSTKLLQRKPSTVSNGPVVASVTTPAAPVVKLKTKPARHKPSGGKTRLELAVDIARANPNASRQELIAMLVAQLGMTPAGASTYASTARKAAAAN